MYGSGNGVDYDARVMRTRCRVCRRGGEQHRTERCKDRNHFDRVTPHKARVKDAYANART